MKLVVNHVFKQFKKKEVLTDISFEISSGEIVGLLGPNGAGKTTLMNIISGALSATKGNIVVCGFDILSQSSEAKKQ